MIYKNFATMLPIQKKTKIPTKQWKKDGVPVDFAASDFLGCDVGLCPLAGYIAIDVDVKDGKDGLASLDVLGLSIGETLTQTTPSGGYHLIYKINPKIELKSTVSTLDGIDLRTANQGYIKLYSDWLDYEDDEITTDAITELPSSAIKMLLDAQKETKTRVKNTINTSDLITIDRNNTLTSIAGSLWGQGEDFDAFSDKIHAINSKRCVPCLDAKEVDTIIKSVARYQRDDKTDESALDGLIKSLLCNNIIKEEEENRKKNNYEKMNNDTFKLSGLLKMIFDAINSTSYYINDHLSLASAISLVGSICSSKYRTPSGAKTNVYSVGLAPAGAGKEAGRTFITEALLSSDAGRIQLGEASIKSGAGLITSIKNHSQKLFLIDEFGYYMQALTDKKADSHKKEIASIMLQLYSGKPWLGSAAASDQNTIGIIDDPCVSFYGTSTLTEYYKAINKSTILSGEAPRFIVFDNPKMEIVRNRTRTNIADHTDTMDKINAVIDHTKHIRSDSIVTYLDPVIHAKYNDSDAEEYYEVFCDKIDELKRKSELHSGLWSRACENVQKLATISAISDNHANPLVTIYHLRWAVSIVTHCLNSFEMRLTDAVTSEYGQQRSDVYQIISSKNGVSLTEIGVLAKNISKNIRDQIIDDLYASDEIYYDSIKRSGSKKPTKIFYATK